MNALVSTLAAATAPDVSTSISIGSVEWLAPMLVLLLPLALLPWWRFFDGRMRGSIRYSSIDLLAACTGGVWQRFRFVPTLLRTLAIASLVVCLARPGKADEETRVFVEGVAIQMLVDRSNSMDAHDFTIGDRPVSRLDAVKHVGRAFVDGDGNLKGRPSDLIALIAFGTFADSLCPLTLDHDHLIAALNSTRLGGSLEGGTSIGDAIMLGIERLRDVEARKEIKSRIMILLTDGDDQNSEVPPLLAAEAARSFGIKIYTIGVGRSGAVPVPRRDNSGRIIAWGSVSNSFDDQTLKEIAKTTGGEYFRATDTDSLVRIYETIDELEKTRTEQRRYRQFDDFATDAFRFAGVSMPPLLAVPLVLLALDLLLSGTRLRRLP